MSASSTRITALVQGNHLNEIQRALEPFGIEVDHATRLNEAVEGASSVVLCDDDASGSWRGTVRQMLGAKPDARIVLFSRVADEGMWVEALTAGAYDLLPQPCPRRQLCATVLTALGQTSLMQASMSQAA